MRADKHLAIALSYVEPLSDARTKLEDFFNILLGQHKTGHCLTGFKALGTLALSCSVVAQEIFARKCKKKSPAALNDSACSILK